LYQHRDDNEAQQFLEHLIAKLALVSNAHVLDLACGKGRHSITLAHKGFTVVGADLAANSIAAAEQNRVALGLDNLNFVVHDMRKPLEGSQFDAIFNLFTSFGYFDTLEENQAVCKSIAQMLNAEGLLVIDFLNAHKVCKQLKPSEVISREGADFNIKRWHDQKHIFKQIEVIDTIQNTVVGTFTERVQALSLANFEALLSPYFEIEATFGSYALDSFHEQDSDRLIIIAKKRP
jgi:cyclopropane fatty-acyl-phospholipid synthase-like methyltransferase